MATSKKASIICFIVSLLLAWFLPSFAIIQFHYVAAPLVMLMYNCSLAQTLWMSLLGGLLLDALTLSPRLGFLALTYLLATRLLYPYRLYFFKDSVLTLPVMTFLFSLFCSGLEVIIALFFDIKIGTVHWSDFLFSPLKDATFAAIVFELPAYVWAGYKQHIRRKMRSEDS